MGRIREEEEKKGNLSLIYWQHYLYIKRCVTIVALYMFVSCPKTDHYFLQVLLSLSRILPTDDEQILVFGFSNPLLYFYSPTTFQRGNRKGE